MTVEQGEAEAVVRIRTSRRAWIVRFVSAGAWVALASGFLLIDRLPLAALGSLAFSCAWIAQALWIRQMGIDLTRESANVRNAHRRRIRWHEIQAVDRCGQPGKWGVRWLDAWGVRFILESGKPVTLRAPTISYGRGYAEYERDFDRISQWWLTHRGESWRPLREEEPGPPVRG
jgi:hypothetical protein